jgi:zinc transporter ZupT
MFSLAIALGLVTAAANILGSCLAVLYRRPSSGFTAGTLGFSGGFVLAAALVEIVPESLTRGPTMPAFVSLGYLLVFVVEQLFNVHLHHLPEEGHSSSLGAASGLASLVAFNVHDFIDGIAIGTGMVNHVNLGLIIFFAVLLHELPAGFVIAAILRGAGWSRRAAVAAGASLGIITLVGIAVPFWLGEISGFATDALLAISGGTFIYLGATLLVPLCEAGKSRAIPFVVVLGFGAFFLSDWLVSFLAP